MVQEDASTIFRSGGVQVVCNRVQTVIRVVRAVVEIAENLYFAEHQGKIDAEEQRVASG